MHSIAEATASARSLLRARQEREGDRKPNVRVPEEEPHPPASEAEIFFKQHLSAKEEEQGYDEESLQVRPSQSDGFGSQLQCDPI